MRDPEVFYNREDLWSVASEVTLSESREQATRPMEPNFVLMKLPGEANQEFVEILPFTPANRNNLIGWIAGRSDGATTARRSSTTSPRRGSSTARCKSRRGSTRTPQLSAQLTLWNQQGSHVRRGSLIVIPVGRALLYAEPIYLQAERSPDAGAAPRRARAAGSAGVRPDVRSGDGQPLRRGRPRWPAAVAASPAPAAGEGGGTAPPRPCCLPYSRSSTRRRAIWPTISA